MENAENSISEPPDFKIFSGALQTPPSARLQKPPNWKYAPPSLQIDIVSVLKRLT